MTGSHEERAEGKPFAPSLFRVVVAREDGQPSARVLEVDGDTIHIGAHPSNDVVLRDARVSPFHCSVTRREDGLRVIDTGSQQGTWVSGLSVRDVDLPPMDAEIALGASLIAISVLAATKEPELYPESHWGRLVGGSAGMRRLFAVLERESRSAAPLLIEGEPGSGKTLVAQEVARLGARQGQPFLSVDCRALTSEREGGTTELDQQARQPGPLHRAFTLSSGGTLLLENVDELPLPLQQQLLRFLEAQAGGGATPLRADDVKIVATSSGSLRRAVNRGLFLEDLHFRLWQGAAVRVPPLRDRIEDVPLLIQAFLSLEHPSARSWRFTSGTLQDLRRREWPGNVRELFEYVTRTLGLDRTDDAPSQSARVEPAFASEAPEGPPSVVEEPFKVRKERLIESFEREYLRELMAWAAGNVSRAARKARIDRMYLHRLLVRHGIERRQFPEH
jgi:DNA-binding NtrC family response regulator